MSLISPDDKSQINNYHLFDMILVKIKNYNAVIMK